MTTIDCLNISYVVCGVNFIVEIYFMYMWFWNKILLKLVKQKSKKLNKTTTLEVFGATLEVIIWNFNM